ncbi:MAG: MATE family efflux transporter, partial [Pseudomonadota bacterium]
MAGGKAGSPEAITYARVASIAVPIMLANITVPLQGAIDTAIIGNLGSEVYLASVTLGAGLFTLVVALFNFLLMGTSGLTAQAMGSDNSRRLINTLIRGMIIAGLIAVTLFLFRGPIASYGMGIFAGSDAAESLAIRYIEIRAFGFPAELANYVLIGWFAGQERTRRIFEIQVIISIVNVALNILFVIGLGWGIEGVALGTVLASYCGLCFGLWHAWRRGQSIAPPEWRLDWSRVLNRSELARLMSLNRDIFIRSTLLVGSFLWMTRLGSLQGDTILAANGILIHFLHISAYSLDGFAIAAETLVGQALGARSREQVRRSVIVTSLSAVAIAALFSLAALLLSEHLIRLFTNVEVVRAVAAEYALWAVLMPLFGVLA